METGRAQVGHIGPKLAAALTRGAGADALAIDEVRARVEELWPGMPEAARPDLADCLASLTLAAERGQSHTRVVRETLQTVMLIVGTGALATLSAASRQQLTALTGIALPNRDSR